MKLCLYHRYTREIPQPAPFLSWHGAQWGSLGFSCNQNNRGLSGAYVACIYCGLSVKVNTRKMPHGMQKLWTYLLCLFFACVVSKNPKTPNSSPMTDDDIALGGIQGLGSLPCISAVFLFLVFFLFLFFC